MNQYILYMSKTELTAPMDKTDLLAIARRWDAQIYNKLEDARKCVHPLIKFYGMSLCDLSDLTCNLEKHGAGALAKVATSPNRNLYIIKLDDHNQTLTRYSWGK